MRRWEIIGVRSGWGAQDMGTADGPKVLEETIPPSFMNFPKIFKDWHGKEPLSFSNPVPLPLSQAKIHGDHIFDMAVWLSAHVKASLDQGRTPLVLGGDHSIAIGTWSGVKAALKEEEMGLIWVDAHMDAHTSATSPSLNIHGMPIALLLGQGEERFCNLGGPSPKVKPPNLCLMGIRSFEEGEALLLAQMGVRVYLANEIKERGFEATFQEARAHLKGRRFGLSIDIDAFDPEEAPGTGTLEDHGLRFQEVRDVLWNLAQDPAFLGLEMTEFNPHRDEHNKTCQLIWQLATLIAGETP